MTGKLEIYSGPTGELVYNSERGTDVSGYDELVDQAYAEGVLLYQDSKTGEVHSYFNATRNAPEQFIGKYESDSPSDGILAEFKSRLEDELDQVGWPLLADAGGKQEFYNDLGTVSAVKPSPSLDYIKEAVKNSNTVDDLKFGVPDRHTAARLVEHIQSYDYRAEMVVTEAYIPDGYENALVKIYIGESESGAVPIKDTKDAIQQDSLRRSIETVRSSAKDLVSTAASDDVNATRESVVRSLKEAEIESLGLTPKSPGVNETDDLILTWGLRTGILGTVLAVLLIGYLSLSTLATKLTIKYTLQIPLVGYSVGTFPSWLIFAGPTVLLVGFGGWRFLRWGDERLRSGEKDPLHNDLFNDAQELVGALQKLEEEPLINSERELKKRAEEAFEPVGYIYFEFPNSEQYETTIKTAIGASIGLLFVTIIGYILWVGRVRIFENWLMLLEIVLVLTLVSLFGFIVYAIFWLGRKLLSSQLQVARKKRSDQNRSNRAKQSGQSGTESGTETIPDAKNRNSQSTSKSAQQSSKSTHERQNRPSENKKSQTVRQNRRQAKAIRSQSPGNRWLIVSILLIVIFLLTIIGIAVYMGLVT